MYSTNPDPDLLKRPPVALDHEDTMKSKCCGAPSSTGHINRIDFLQSAASCVCKNRDDQYGPPEDSFSEIASLWSTYLNRTISAQDVGIMMALLKIARIKTGTFKDDSYIDAIGYIACAGEIASGKDSSNVQRTSIDRGLSNGPDSINR